MRPRDSQRQAVYTWERELAKQFCSDKEMTLGECRELVTRVWYDYCPGKAVPDVNDGRGRRWATWGWRGITLPRWARRPITVLHEAAHGLQRPGQAAHGREFATIVLELYDRYAGIPKTKARQLGIRQRPRRVHFAKSADVPKPVSRAWRKWYEHMQALRRQQRELAACEPPRNGRARR